MTQTKNKPRAVIFRKAATSAFDALCRDLDAAEQDAKIEQRMAQGRRLRNAGHLTNQNLQSLRRMATSKGGIPKHITDAMDARDV
jgi:hypothetical protein